MLTYTPQLKSSIRNSKKIITYFVIDCDPFIQEVYFNTGSIVFMIKEWYITLQNIFMLDHFTKWNIYKMNAAAYFMTLL